MIFARLDMSATAAPTIFGNPKALSVLAAYIPTITLMKVDLASRKQLEEFAVPKSDDDYTTPLTTRYPRTDAEFADAWRRIDAFMELL